MPTALLTDRHDEIGALCRRFGIARLELFGSAATGQFRSGRSDYDFLVELDAQAEGSPARRIVEFAEALEALLGAPVDLINPRYIRNRYFAAEVERTRTPVYG